MSDKNTSKFISLILRHKPETIGITLDEHGWADVSELIAGVSKTHPLNMEDLERIVAEDEKQRYSFNDDKTLDEETARKVGIRHGKLVLYRIKSGEMHRDGYVFYRSVNGVWLIKAVPIQYMKKISK